MRLKQLEENVRYGQKEKDEVLKSLNDFKFGFEIELNPGDGGIDEDTTFDEYLSNNNLDLTITSSESGDLASLLVDYIIEGETYDVMYAASEQLKIFNDDALSTFNFGDTMTGDMFPFELHYSIIETIIEVLKENDYADMNDMVDTLSTWNDLTSKQWKYVLLGLMEDADVDVSDIKENDLLALSSIFGRIADHLTTIVSFVDTSNYVSDGELIPISDMDTEMRDEFNNFYDSDLEVHVERLMRAVDEAKNNPAYSNEIDFNNINDSDIAKAIETEIDDLFGNQGLGLTEILSHFDLEDRHGDVLYDLIGDADLSGTDEHEAYRLAMDGGDLQSNFDELSNTDNVYFKTEYDGQIEIITTEPVSGDEILDHYSQMREIIQELLDKGFYSGSNSGLHMSISYKNGSTGMNFNKFTILSDMYKITDEDSNSIRNHVGDVFEFLKDSELDILASIVESVKNNENPIGRIVNGVEQNLKKVRTSAIPKYHTINFDDYNKAGGRVELRFFGGDGYENRLDDYYDKLMKFMYILKISSEDSHDTNYYKALVKITNHVFKRMFGMTIDEATRNVKRNAELLNRLGIKNDFNEIVKHYEKFEALYSASKGSEIRHSIMDFLEFIEDNNYDRMMIQPETTITLKALLRSKE